MQLLTQRPAVETGLRTWDFAVRNGSGQAERLRKGIQAVAKELLDLGRRIDIVRASCEPFSGDATTLGLKVQKDHPMFRSLNPVDEAQSIQLYIRTEAQENVESAILESIGIEDFNKTDPQELRAILTILEELKRPK